MPRISRDERSCLFVNEFNEYVTYYDELNIDITQKFSKITRAVNSNSPKRDDRMPLGQI